MHARAPRELALAAFLFGSLAALLSPSGADAQHRPDAVGTSALFHFEDGEVVEYFDAERVRVHYSREGANAVRVTDADDSGVPDFVELVAESYEAALEFYSARGFREPVSDAAIEESGGDGRFDVYLVDFGGNADGAFQVDTCDDSTCIGYMAQENDFVGYGYPDIATAVRIVSSHELFHAVQAAYARDLGNVFSEATAVWATDQFDASLGEVEAFAPGYLETSTRPLDQDSAGIVLDPFAYGSSIFFQFLSEHLESDLVLPTLEGLSTADSESGWLDVLSEVLDAEHGLSFAEVFVEFASWNALTGTRSLGLDTAQVYSVAAQLPDPAFREEALPLLDDAPRHFYAATRYYRVSPGDRSDLVARLVGEDCEGLRLRAFVGGDPYTLSEVSEDALSFAVQSEPVIVAVINTSREGPSRRASLCVGSSDEVDACAMELSEVPDGGTDPMTMVDGGTDPMTTVDEGGCAAAGTSPLGGAWLALLGLLALRRRRAR